MPSMETTAATAQMLINNPMMQQYGQVMATRGQAMLDSSVSNTGEGVCDSIAGRCGSMGWKGCGREARCSEHNKQCGYTFVSVFLYRYPDMVTDTVTQTTIALVCNLLSAISNPTSYLKYTYTYADTGTDDMTLARLPVHMGNEA